MMETVLYLLNLNLSSDFLCTKNCSPT